MEFRLELLLSQDKFLFSQAKFPLFKAGIGVGKTMLMLLKVMQYCKRWPGTTALIVRKEFTDLHDSTMVDFEKYFQDKVGSDKNYVVDCGPDKPSSLIMFRHAAEIAVLKNINLGIAAMEQAEEFEDDTQFQFIRDRLRQQNGADIRPLIVIANANGHNWIYNLWLKGAHRQALDVTTGQYHYTKGEYECATATTFANERNLPADFIADCKAKEIEAPNHYKQYILNDDDVTQQDDFVFTFQELEEARTREYAKREHYGLKLTGFDVARYGNDKCAAVCIQQMGALIWKVRYVDEWEKKDGNYTIGRIQNIVRDLNSDGNIIDEDGLGGPMLDVINANIKYEDDQYKGFRNLPYKFVDNRDYGNPRTKAAFDLKHLILKGHISLTDEDLCQELLTLRYTFTTDGRKILISKEKMRKEGIVSPNKADALLMAVSLIGDVKAKQDRQYEGNQPQYAQEKSLFEIAGVK